jgi:hypothetical protein
MHDLTHDGNWNKFDENVLKLYKVSSRGVIRALQPNINIYSPPKSAAPHYNGRSAGIPPACVYFPRSQYLLSTTGLVDPGSGKQSGMPSKATIIKKLAGWDIFFQLARPAALPARCSMYIYIFFFSGDGNGRAAHNLPNGVPVFSCGPDSEHHIKRCMYLHVSGKLLVALEEGLLNRTRERRFPYQLGVLKLLMIFLPLCLS